MNVIRAALVAAILLNLALLAAAGPARTTVQRYSLAKKRQELRALALENRDLLHQVALARRPDRVAARARDLGLDLEAVEHQRIDRPSAAPRAEVAKARTGRR